MTDFPLHALVKTGGKKTQQILYQVLWQTGQLKADVADAY